jgi:hypothetical protein
MVCKALLYRWSNDKTYRYNIGGVQMSLYRYPICPAYNCYGELVADFDVYGNPSMVYIICKKCAHIVTVLYGAKPVEAISSFSIPIATAVAF